MNNNTDKQVILIGGGSYFTDSFLFFKEQGFQLICIELEQTVSWFNNYKLLRSIGFEIIRDTPSSHYLDKIKLTPHTLIFRGSYSGDGPQFPDELKSMCKREMEIFYELSRRNTLQHCGAKAILCFCGDNIYETAPYIDWFSEKSQYADLLLFDNDLIKKYVLTNIPMLHSKPNWVEYFETPLLRWVQHNTGTPIEKKRLMSLGRCICTFDVSKEVEVFALPSKTPIVTGIFQNLAYQWKYKTLHNFQGRTTFKLASVATYKHMQRDRKMFFMLYGNYAFGLSHIYNLFEVNPGELVDLNGAFDYKNATYIKSTVKKIFVPQTYALANNASKDVTYLMLGIIPIIPHIEHSFYKMLYEKKMAILVRNVQDLKHLSAYSDKEIQEYRNNIYANRHLFTFEKVGNRLIDLVGGR